MEEDESKMMRLDIQLFGGRGQTSSTDIGQGRNESENKSINKLAKQTANLKNEQYRIIDENGNVLLLKKGEQDSVVMSVGEKREFMEGHISLHNHPRGGTFSSEDINDFGFGAKEIVVSSPEGQYRLINTKYGTKEAKSGWKPMQEALNKATSGELDYFKLRKQATENVKKTKIQKQYDALSKETMRMKNKLTNEQFREWVNKTNAKHQETWTKLQKARDKETRRLETKAYHDFFKRNARKYGFRYITNSSLY